VRGVSLLIFLNHPLRRSKLGEAVSLGFSIGLHARDGQLLYSLCDYFKCGKVKQRLNKKALDFRVKKYSDITGKIIPFFENYPIKGEKSKDFEDLKKVGPLRDRKRRMFSGRGASRKARSRRINAKRSSFNKNRSIRYKKNQIRYEHR